MTVSFMQDLQFENKGYLSKNLYNKKIGLLKNVLSPIWVPSIRQDLIFNPLNYLDYKKKAQEFFTTDSKVEEELTLFLKTESLKNFVFPDFVNEVFINYKKNKFFHPYSKDSILFLDRGFKDSYLKVDTGVFASLVKASFELEQAIDLKCKTSLDFKNAFGSSYSAHVMFNAQNFLNRGWCFHIFLVLSVYLEVVF